MGNRMGLSSHRGRRRRAVDGEQLLALGAAAVAKAGGEACTKAGRAKEDGVGRAAVVLVVGASPPPVADFPALHVSSVAFAYAAHAAAYGHSCGPAVCAPRSSASARSWSGHAVAAAPRATATSTRMRRLILIYLTISIRELAKAAASISGHN